MNLKIGKEIGNGEAPAMSTDTCAKLYST